MSEGVCVRCAIAEARLEEAHARITSLEAQVLTLIERGARSASVDPPQPSDADEAMSEERMAFAREIAGAFHAVHESENFRFSRPDEGGGE